MQLAGKVFHAEAKLCPKCETPKLLEDFGVAKTRPGGRCGWCKACKSADMRRRRTLARQASRPKRAPRVKRVRGSLRLEGLAALMRDRHADFGGSRQ